jgi:hypothetical protein
VSKGREIRAVLITPEQFKRHFLDYQSEERKKQLLKTIRTLKENRVERRESIEVLRELRGYAR